MKPIDLSYHQIQKYYKNFLDKLIFKILIKINIIKIR